MSNLSVNQDIMKRDAQSNEVNKTYYSMRLEKFEIFDANSVSTESSGGSLAGDSMVVPALSKRDQFFAAYKCQAFSLPDSVMFYIAKNPPSPELYQKLVESCKYFFIKNPVIVTSYLCYPNDKWQISQKPYDLNKYSCQIWITDSFVGYVDDSAKNEPVYQNIISSIIPKLYRCDAKDYTLCNQNICYRDLSFLVSSAQNIRFRNVSVKNHDGSNVPVEKIMEVAVKAKTIFLKNPSVTCKTMKELIKIPHFKKLDKFAMTQIPGILDLEAFYVYMKTNKRTKFWLEFGNLISDDYKTRVKEIIDEIITAKTFDYKPAHISFDGLDENIFKKLDHIYLSHY